MRMGFGHLKSFTVEMDEEHKFELYLEVKGHIMVTSCNEVVKQLRNLQLKMKLLDLVLLDVLFLQADYLNTSAYCFSNIL